MLFNPIIRPHGHGPGGPIFGIASIAHKPRERGGKSNTTSFSLNKIWSEFTASQSLQKVATNLNASGTESAGFRLPLLNRKPIDCACSRIAVFHISGLLAAYFLIFEWPAEPAKPAGMTKDTLKVGRNVPISDPMTSAGGRTRSAGGRTRFTPRAS